MLLHEKIFNITIKERLLFHPLMLIIIVQHFYAFYTLNQLSRIHLTHEVTYNKIVLIKTENMAW